ncbi:hypothetical protein D3C75_1080070 [compost metagenome]
MGGARRDLADHGEPVIALHLLLQGTQIGYVLEGHIPALSEPGMIPQDVGVHQKLIPFVVVGPG